MSKSQRFTIGEWYGHSYTGLTTDERHVYAGRPKDQPCPFRLKGDTCTKAGGVCAFRLYEDDDGFAAPVRGPEDGLRVLCPYRFEEDRTIFRWVSETILGISDPAIVEEVGFLRAEDDQSHVGRIDMVLADRESPADRLDWCALEIQAVYFSGTAMAQEFRRIGASPDERPPFPDKVRRPDYRSSGPKRLMPQLQIKVPTLRRWGKKTAVLVDKHFFGSLGRMEEVSDLSNGDVVWFTVDFEEAADGRSFRLVPEDVHITTLERATEGLTGGYPVTLAEFENDIRARLI